MSEQCEYLFVYGTLRRDSVHPMAGYLRANAKHMGSASIMGSLYRISWYPAFVPDGKSRVMGDVFLLSNSSEALGLLDQYEGIDRQDSGESEYIRRQMDVTCADGSVLPAWIYIFNRDVTGLQRIVSGDFLAE